jgi:hypothetical protein
MEIATNVGLVYLLDAFLASTGVAAVDGSMYSATISQYLRNVIHD